jgi:hypothetical protein
MRASQRHNKPIRPIVNWKESPGYKLAKHIKTILNNIIKMPNIFNIQNSHHLSQSLMNTKIDTNMKLCSFDTENMYTNIPITEIKNIIKNIMNNDNLMSKEEKEELSLILDTILEQNYLLFNNQYFKQNRTNNGGTNICDPS